MNGAPPGPVGLRLAPTLQPSDDARAMLTSIGAALVTEQPDSADGVASGDHAAPPPVDDPATGLSLGATIGTGGTAVVRTGVQRVLDRTVAVKEGRRDLGRPDLGRILLLEARITGMLEHPNIIPIHDVATGPDGPRIVMRQVTGSSWTALLADPALAAGIAGETDPFEWHLRVLIQVCNAVHFAHSKGIVHRDLKPDNVMIGAYGEVYVVDWGLAVTTRDLRGVPRAERQRSMAGTPAFMAPEMLGQPVTERTDVFLLGAMLYTLVVGQPPYSGRVDDAMFARIRAASPPIPETVPAGLADILRRAMAPAPVDRYPSADELRVAVERYLRHRGAEVLATQARVQLGRLLSLLAREPVERLAVYDLFGQCRFGFEQALRIDPDRADAAAGRAAAIVAMARFEVARRDPDAARLLLADLPAVPPDLQARITDLHQARDDEQADLARMRRDRDPEIGRRARLFVVVALSLAWTLLPLVAPWIEAPITGGTTYPGLIGVDLGFLAAIVGSGLVLRRQLLTTDFNRWIIGSVLLTMLAQIVLDSGCWLAGLPAPLGHAFHLFLWFVVSSFGAIVLERRLAIPMVAYLVGFGVGVERTSLVYPAISVSNAVLLGVVLWMWARGWARRRA